MLKQLLQSQINEIKLNFMKTARKEKNMKQNENQDVVTRSLHREDPAFLNKCFLPDKCLLRNEKRF